jgi:zinc transport system ATP-binding protein
MSRLMSSDSPKILLSCRNITVGYPDFSLSGISLQISSNDFVYLTGPNGGGKTTLLKSIGGILPPLSGQWEREPGLRVGYVPQQTAIDPVFPLSAREIIQHGHLGRTVSARTRERFSKLLSEFNLSTVLRTPFRQLSGGQRQRVLIVRALLGFPGMLLLDEPTSGLDTTASATLMHILASMAKDDNMGIIMVTHQVRDIPGRGFRRLEVDFNRGEFKMTDSFHGHIAALREPDLQHCKGED